MNKSFLLITISLFSLSCEIHVKTTNAQFEKLGATFLDDLYHRRTQQCIQKMDPKFIAVAKDINLDSAFNLLADKLHDDFKGDISSDLILYKDTVYENLSATYLKYQVVSSNRTGYYNFYVNNKAGKILLITVDAK